MTSKDVNGESVEIERLQSEVADLRRRLVDAPLQKQDLEIELRETKKKFVKQLIETKS